MNYIWKEIEKLTDKDKFTRMITIRDTCNVKQKQELKQKQKQEKQQKTRKMNY